MTAKPWVCRLYPERKSSLFVRVHVWPTKKDFLAHVNKAHFAADGKGFGRRCDGTCSRVDVKSYRTKRDAAKKARGRRDPCCAVVNMWQGCLTMRVVTHELFHATIAWGHRVKFPFAGFEAAEGVTADEERITYVHGELCRQFMCKALAPGGPYTKQARVRPS